MNERRAIKVPLGMLKGKPMSTSVPTFEFRFHAAEEQLEEIYPEIEEEVAVPLDPAEIAPVAPPRSPKPSHSAKCSPGPKLPRSLHSPVSSSPEPSPLKEALKPGILSKRSTSMETGIGESAVAGPAAASDTWRLLHELKGKITRTVEDKFTEIKNDRIARSENRKNRLAASSGKKDDASFSDSEDASSSENSNQIFSNSNSALQSSGVSSLSTTPTGTGAGFTSGSRTRKFSKADDEQAGSHSRPTTPIPDKGVSGKATRAGSVPTLIAESPTLEVPPKRSLSLRGQMKPKLCDLRNRRKKGDSRSNVSISSAAFSADGEESDDGDGTDAVEEGVEALEEDWLDTTVTPSVPLGTMLSALNDGMSDAPPPPPPPPLTLKQKVYLHRYVLVVIALGWLMAMLPVIPVTLFVLLGALTVVLVQEEMKVFTTPSPSVASINMGYAPFAYPNYSEMPALKVPAAAQVLPAPCFEGWMNDFAGKYETNSYHISLTESVFVRLEGSLLTLKYTRAKIPKRAMWNEPASRKVTFTEERHFNIRGCQVKLLPEGIARRRQWSKKYPICIVLNSVNAIATPDETADLEIDEVRPVEEKENEKDAEKEKREETPFSKKITTSAKYAKSSTESLELTILRSDESFGDLSKESKASSEPTSRGPLLRTGSSKEGNSDLSGAEAEDDESFSIINSDVNNCLYLFARADREKEEWYRRFAEAVRPHRGRNYETELDVNQIPIETPIEIDDSIPLSPSLAIATLTEYLRYMQAFHLENKPFLIHPPKTSSTEKEEKKRDKDKDKEKEKEKHKDSEREREKEFEAIMTASEERGAPMAWLNALVGRVCFDILRSAQWKKRLHQRLQKKLSTLKLPYFVEDLTLTELDLGDSVPLIHRTSQPTLDVRGLWLEMDVTYQGGFRMTIESKLNLMKLKRNVSIDAAAALLATVPTAAESPSGVPPPPTSSAAIAAAAAASNSRSPVFDSDLDDSAESSSDDDHSGQTDDGQRGPGANPGKTTGKKFLRMVDRIAASKYFQQATEMKYIKKAMEGVSNTRIMLSVELRGLVGTLALNVPPPPSDRLWYGFHGNPKLWLTARPTLGEKQVNFNQISNWIEQKLCQEFQKVLVLPNMDDLVIPVMSSHLPV